MEYLNINLDGFATAKEVRELSKGLGLLASYARAKAKAMTNRAAGNVTSALILEGQCEFIYQKLPGWARW